MNFIVRALLVSLATLLFISSATAQKQDSGERLYQQCVACHSFGYNRTGPDHCGVVGRSAGSQQGFEYTEAMKSAEIVWSTENLSQFLIDPSKMIPGTSMGFITVKSEEDRQQIIRYIEQQATSAECNE